MSWPWMPNQAVNGGELGGESGVFGCCRSVTGQDRVAVEASTATVAGLDTLLAGTTRNRLADDMSRAMKGRRRWITHIAFWNNSPKVLPPERDLASAAEFSTTFEPARSWGIDARKTDWLAPGRRTDHRCHLQAEATIHRLVIHQQPSYREIAMPRPVASGCHSVMPTIKGGG